MSRVVSAAAARIFAPEPSIGPRFCRGCGAEFDFLTRTNKRYCEEGCRTKWRAQQRASHYKTFCEQCQSSRCLHLPGNRDRKRREPPPAERLAARARRNHTRRPR